MIESGVTVILASILLVMKPWPGLSSTVLENVQVPSILVELGFVCDKEFSEIFQFNEERINQLVVNMVGQVEADFQTLHSVHVQFAVTSVLIMRNADEQPFIELVKNENGTTQISEIKTKFDKWVYDKKISNTSDVVVLITNSQGHSGLIHGTNGACVINQVEKSYKSTLVFRVPRLQDWSVAHLLSYGLGFTFGAPQEAYTSCNTTIWLMTKTFNYKAAHYFSNCSDENIYKLTYLSSEKTCLTRNQISAESKKISDIKRIPFTLTEQCQLKCSDCANVTADQITQSFDSCPGIKCYRNLNDTPEYITNVYPWGGTPCGRNKVCFRGNCRSEGVIIKNTKSKKCILPSTFQGTKKVLAVCPAYPLNFEKFSVSYNLQLGVLISAPSKNINFNDTALTIYNNQIQFSDINNSSFHVTNVLWDILEVDDGSYDVLICHRYTQKCLSSNSNDELVLDDGADAADPSKRWRLENSSLEFYPTYKRQPVETEHIIQKVIRLAIVCDQNCGKAFGFNETASSNYWTICLADAVSKFEPLATIKISFVVTSLNNLWGNDNINKNKIHSSTSESLEAINESFGVWLYSHINEFPAFDIAVLGTAFLETKLKSFSNLASACKTNAKANRIPGTLVFRVDMPKSNEFLELADSLSRTLKQEEKNVVGQLEWYNPCAKNLFSFSNCEENQMRQYLMSEEANCLTSINSEPKGFSGKVPLFEEQCNFLRNKSDLIVKEEEKNCFVTRCLSHQDNNLFVRNIYPLHGTPCGIEKYCLWGNCVSKGHLLQKVDTTMCLSGTRLFSPNDLVTLSDCRSVSSSLNHFTIAELSDQTGYLLVSPLSPADKTDSDGKCLTWEPEREYLHYNPCPRDNFEKFVWNILEVSNSNGQFLLYHKPSKKCIGVTRKTVFPTNTNCEFLDLISNETVTRDGCRMPTKPYVDMQFVSDSTCSLADMSLRWQKLSISNEYLENVVDNIIPPPKIFADHKHKTLTENPNFLAWILVGVALLVLMFSSVVGIAIVRRRSRIRSASERYEMLLGESFYQGNVNKINPDISVTAQVDLLPFDKQLEFPFDQLCLGKFLGAGTQGKVFEGKAFGITTNQDFTHVAVKVVETTASSSVDHFHDLLSELKILCHVGRHLNVIGLLGACTKDFNVTKKMCMITEYCKHGNLRDFLLQSRASFVNIANVIVTNDLVTISRQSQGNHFVQNHNLDKPISTHDLIWWSFQLAQGMEYLASKKVLHGDLAARNVLLAENSIIKVCDFGFSRKLAQGYNYNYKKCMTNTKMPVKWMAVESFKYGLFSIQSDCWAYGVVLWEMFSLGDIPYGGTEVDENFVNRLYNGYRLEKPEFSPSRIYDIMNQCWSQEPETRPKFSDLVAKLGDMLTSEHRENYAQLNAKFQNNLIRKEIGNPAKGPQHPNERMEVKDPNGCTAPTLRQENYKMHSDNSSGACSLLENQQGCRFVKEQY